MVPDRFFIIPGWFLWFYSSRLVCIRREVSHWEQPKRYLLDLYLGPTIPLGLADFGLMMMMMLWRQLRSWSSLQQLWQTHIYVINWSRALHSYSNRQTKKWSFCRKDRCNVYDCLTQPCYHATSVSVLFPRRVLEMNEYFRLVVVQSGGCAGWWLCEYCRLVVVQSAQR